MPAAVMVVKLHGQSPLVQLMDHVSAAQEDGIANINGGQGQVIVLP